MFLSVPNRIDHLASAIAHDDYRAKPDQAHREVIE